MLIDCDTCAVRGPACEDCVVTVLLGAPPVASAAGPAGEAFDLDPAERAAIAVLAGSGLVPPLRLVPAEPADPSAGVTGPAPARACGRHGPPRRAAEAG